MLRSRPFTTAERAPRVRTPAVPIPVGQRRGVLALCDAMNEAAPKPEPKRNRHLLDMARGAACLMRIPGICNGDRETTVAAHSNLLMHAKGRGRKADDCYTVAACATCHTWLDSSYSATYQQKEMAFMRGHLRQVDAWRAIAINPRKSEADRSAAQWALEQLNATPVGFDGNNTPAGAQPECI